MSKNAKGQHQCQLPCRTCVTYAMCLLKPIITCPIVDDYVLEFGIKDEYHGQMNIASIHYREYGWTLIPERVKELLSEFNTPQYSANYSMGSITFYPGISDELRERIEELKKDGVSLQNLHNVRDLSKQDSDP